MTATQNSRIGIVGGGIMGVGIAEVCARPGLQVTVVKVDPDARDRARQTVERSIARAGRRGKLAESDASERREQLFASPASLQRLVAGGLLGRRTGGGLHSY